MTRSLGIDLGTTHTVVATVNDQGLVQDVPIVQLVAAGEQASRPSLPSACYLPHADEVDVRSLQLPWTQQDSSPQTHVLGEWAKHTASKLPGRVITSAKSWLSMNSVDRTAPILPWAAGDDVRKASPLDVQRWLLQHVRNALDHAHDQPITLTIPASFDAVARDLTLRAAREAGFANVFLLEEPQAAMYAWLQQHQHDLRAQLDQVRLVLVVDVGGGTTDFTLLGLEHVAQGPPIMTRIAVGEHLMLGGDNMDMTLARVVEQSITGAPGSLDAVSFAQLMASARAAKEALLSDGAPSEMAVSLPARGKSLLGGMKSSMQQRTDVETLLVDGFFGACSIHDDTTDKRKTLAEFGLPYARDTSIPRQLLGFLRRHAAIAAEAGARMMHGLPMPDAVLLNGGVFNSARLQRQLLQVMSSWFGSDIRTLTTTTDALDAAVARGAAYANEVREGRGVRIRGGSARAYFLGIDGADGNPRALCVVPHGQSEGQLQSLPQSFSLVVGQPTRFPLYTSTQAHGVRLGDVVDITDDMTRLPSLQTVVERETTLPVQVQSLVTDVGSLELTMQMTPQALQRFSLSFSTRIDASVLPTASADAPTSVPSVSMGKKADEAKQHVLLFFGSKGQDTDTRKVKDMRRDLERLLGAREGWPASLNRELASTLLTGAKRRRRSADHERTYFQQMGFLLRPGMGAPFDDWRMQQLWPLWQEGVQHISEKLTWSSWFIMWRRVAPGLSTSQQQEMWLYLKPWLLQQGTGVKGSGPTPSGTDEMIRLASSLERITATEKVVLGQFLLKKLGRDGLTSYWPLARVGARVPFAAAADSVVPPDVAAGWCEKVLERDLKTAEHASFALVQMARMTGDRARDLPLSLRSLVIERLRKVEVPQAWIDQVEQVVAVDQNDNAVQLGDELPAGLSLGT
jgi:molecular chaperone DnaK (HSP70)